MAHIPLETRVQGQAFAVNEDTGMIVQVTDKGYLGMLCVARKSMKLYIIEGYGSPRRRGSRPLHRGHGRRHGGGEPPDPNFNDADPEPRPHRISSSRTLRGH